MSARLLRHARMPRPGSRRARRWPAVIAAVVLLVSANASPAAAAPKPPPCSLVPQLRSVTINQGVGSYAKLARGKETLVRLFLSLPACASTSNSIALTGGSLEVRNGTAVLGTVASPTPAPVAPFALLAPAGSAPATDAPADPKFVVPGSVLAPAGATGQFTATFRATVTYQSRTSSNASPVNGTITFTSLTGSTSPIQATVEQRANALRILVVPMGDASRTFDSQFSQSANAAIQNAMATLARTWPLPGGVSDLSGSGGVRYQINPALLDVRPQMVADATGALRYCGTGANFDAVKGLMAQYLQSWNTANPTRTADIVLGAVDEAISNGSANACAEGMASVSGPQAWIRAVYDRPNSPSISGALASMEVAHTQGLVPAARYDRFSPYHSPNLRADGTAPNTGYNVTLRSFLADPRTAMTLSGTWNNNTVVYEPPDYGAILCKLGGQTTPDCATPAVIGTATGVQAGPRFVMSGVTDGTPGGTAVVESYFARDVAPTLPDPASPFRLVQRAGSTVLSDLGVPVSEVRTNHDHPGTPGQTESTALRLFTISFAFETGADAIELRTGSTVLYARSRNANGPPTVGSVITNTSSGAATNLSNDPLNDDTEPSLTSDASWVAWASEGVIQVAPVASPDEAVAMPDHDEIPITAFGHPAWGPPAGGDGRLAYVGDGRVWTRRVTLEVPPAFDEPFLVYDGAAGPASSPSWSPDAGRIAFEAGGDVWVVNATGTGLVRLTTTGDASEPSWSRDPGDPRIAYVRRPPLEGTYRSPTAARALTEGPWPVAADHAGRVHYSVRPPSGPAPMAPDGPTDTYVVTSPDDTTDGTCDAHCTLREAIDEANATGGGTIHFAIAPTGTIATIATTGYTITTTLTIDGTTQLGGGSDPGVEIVGPAPDAATGFLLDLVPGVEIRGLIVHGFTDAIVLSNSGGNTIAGNWLGLDASGEAAPGNANHVVIDGTDAVGNVVGGLTPADRNVMATTGGGSTGVYITNGASNNDVVGNYVGTDKDGTTALSLGGQNGVELEGAGAGNVIGGPDPSHRNVISGNGKGVVVSNTTLVNTIQGNYIGLAADGTAALGNSGAGVEVTIFSADTVIRENVVSGSVFGEGILVSSGDATTIRSNRVGTDSTGTAAVPNALVGIRIVDGSHTIGGSGVGEGNLVSGNTQYGIQLNTDGNTVQGNLIGTDAAATAAIPNQKGISIFGAGNLIGGVEAGEGNLVSGNAQEGITVQGDGNTIRGNRVGTSAAGTAAVGNLSHGIYVVSGTGNEIGGSVAGAGNLVSGQASAAGIRIDGDANFVRGNRIGTNLAGTAAIPNSDGVVIIAAGNVIGGGTAAERNLVSGNTQSGILLSNSGTTGNQVVGNWIGLDATGTVAIGNAVGVLSQVGATVNQIGTNASGNVISGNTTGIQLQSGAGVERVIGNRIGTNPAGTAVIPNGVGIRVNGSGSSVIGDSTAGGGNLVSGNTGAGIQVIGSGAAVTSLRNNLIGTTVDGTSALPNAVGVDIGSGATGIIVGDTSSAGGNTIKFNTGDGVRIASGVGNRVRGNRIDQNGGLGVDLVGTVGVTANDPGDPDVGPNNLQNFPVLTSAMSGASTTINGTLNSTASRTFDIDFYASPTCDASGNGEGATYLGLTATTTSGGGNASFSFVSSTLVPPGQVVTAIAIDTVTSDTSEFSACRTVTAGLVVTNTNDSGAGSLRAAIDAANAAPDNSTVSFSISGVGTHTIQPLSALPVITSPITLDATTQPGYAGCPAAPLIELDGSLAGAGTNGLVIDIGASLIRGFAINRFAGNGIELSGVATGTHVECSVIGLDPGGTIDLGNGGSGIRITSPNNTIGGTTSATRNVISGNTGVGIFLDGGTGTNFVQGNFIGTNATGTAAIGNNHGIVISGSNSNQIGAEAGGGGNRIAGNAGQGIVISNGAANNTIRNNQVGTATVGNGANGIDVLFTAGPNSIGGLGPGQSNGIFSNGRHGVLVEGNGQGTSISGNAISGNGQLGIDLSALVTPLGDGVTPNDPDDPDTGGNGLQNFPVIDAAFRTSATTGMIRGTLDSTAGRSFRLEFFSNAACDASGHGEGATLVTNVTVTTDGSGDATFAAPTAGLTLGHAIVGTATDLTTGATSEFSACATVVNGADLSIGSASRSPEPVTAGATLTESFTVSNGGPATATGVTIAADIGTFTLGSTTGTTGCSGTTGLVSCTLAALASGANQAITIELGAPAASGAYSHTWSASANEPDAAPGNNSTTLSGTIAGNPDLALSGTRDPDPVMSGDDLVETLTITNVGAATATGISLTATVGLGFDFVGATGATCSGTSTLACSVADIAGGGSAEVSIVLRGTQLGTYSHDWNVSGTGDPNAANDDVSLSGEVISPCAGFDQECIWLIDPSGGDPAATRVRVIGDGRSPSWDASGRIAFERDRTIRTADLDGSNEIQVTATADFDGDPWLAAGRIAFGRLTTVPFDEDVWITSLAGQSIVYTGIAPAGTNPIDLRADVLLVCGGSAPTDIAYLVAVGVRPSTVSGQQANFETIFDPSLSCAGGTITVILTDGFLRSAVGPGSQTTVGSDEKPPVAAVAGPPIDSERLQFDTIPLRGSGKDAEDGQLPSHRLSWHLAGPGGLTRSATGPAPDLPVPGGGWPVGSYVATLTVTDSTGRSDTAETTFRILADADHDGIPAPLDRTSCTAAPGSADNNPANAFGDLDGDGLPNVSDPAPCTAATAFVASAIFDPTSLNLMSSGGPVTMFVSIQGKDMRQVRADTVRIAKVNGIDPADSDEHASSTCARSLPTTRWTATATEGTAKFDRQALIGWFRCMGITDRPVEVVIAGATAGNVQPAAWSFEGTGITNVQH